MAAPRAWDGAVREARLGRLASSTLKPQKNNSSNPARGPTPDTTGAAMGVYNTLQSLGLFAGGVIGGGLMKQVGAQGLFAACGAIMLAWLVVAWPMKTPAVAAAGLAPKAG